MPTERVPSGVAIHGGGKGLPDPYIDDQGWRPTAGCFRMQNSDVNDLISKMNETSKIERDMGIAPVDNLLYFSRDASNYMYLPDFGYTNSNDWAETPYANYNYDYGSSYMSDWNYLDSNDFDYWDNDYWGDSWYDDSYDSDWGYDWQ